MCRCSGVYACMRACVRVCLRAHVRVHIHVRLAMRTADRASLPEQSEPKPPHLHRNCTVRSSSSADRRVRDSRFRRAIGRLQSVPATRTRARRGAAAAAAAADGSAGGGGGGSRRDGGGKDGAAAAASDGRVAAQAVRRCAARCMLHVASCTLHGVCRVASVAQHLLHVASHMPCPVQNAARALSARCHT